jgi:BlaI family transcriptional regulator, penicillinase repressor
LVLTNLFRYFADGNIKAKKMKKLTAKEKEIMDMFWHHGPMFVRDLLKLYPDPKPHFNTVSTQVRILESNGYVSHEAVGNSYRYRAAITEEAYGKSTLAGVIKNYFDNSYLSAVSAFVKEKKISVDELRDLIEQIEQGK